MLFDSTIQKEQLIFADSMLNRLAENASHVWRTFFVWKKNEVRTSGKYSKFDFQNVFMKKSVSFRILACNFWKGRFLPQRNWWRPKKPIGTNHFGLFGRYRRALKDVLGKIQHFFLVAQHPGHKTPPHITTAFFWGVFSVLGLFFVGENGWQVNMIVCLWQCFKTHGG